MRLSTIIEEAKKLSQEERDELIEALFNQPHDPRSGLELTTAQAMDLDRRIDEVRSGNVEMIDGPTFIEQLMKKRS